MKSDKIEKVLVVRNAINALIKAVNNLADSDIKYDIKDSIDVIELDLDEYEIELDEK